MPPSSRNKTPKARGHGHGHRKSSTCVVQRAAPMKGGGISTPVAVSTQGTTGGALGTASAMGTALTMSPLWTYAIYVAMFVILGMIVYMLWLLLARMERGHKNMEYDSVHRPEEGGNAVNFVGATPSTPHIAGGPHIAFGNLFGPLASISTRTDPFNDPYVPPLKVDTTYFPSDSGDIRGLPVVAGIAGSRGYGPNSSPAGSVPIPINVRTRGYEPEFSQLGILVRDRGSSEQDRDSRNGNIGRAKYQATFGARDDPNDTTHVNPRADSSSLYDNQILPLMGRRVLNGRDKYQYYTLGGAGGNAKLPIQVRGRNAMDENGVDEIMNNDRTFVPGYGHAYRADIYQNALYRYLPSFL